MDGTYTENVDVNKSLTIQSENGSDFSIVRVADSNDHVFEVTADYVNISGFRVEGATGIKKAAIHLKCVNNCSVSGNIVLNNSYGIYLNASSNNTITGNNCSRNPSAGIELVQSSGNILTNNDIFDNECEGIFFELSSNNTISNNNITKSDFGIHFLSSSSNNNIVDGNYFSNNIVGILGSSNNVIRNNNITNSSYQGINVWYNNLIYLNNFINNSQNVDSMLSTNILNSTSKITYTFNGNTYINYLGNHWDDYNGTDENNDGIGDTHYLIDSNKDNYPLMEPFEIYFVPTENIFDTDPGTYPSISGTHNGTITPNQTITVSTLYTYPCSGTGGHSECIKIWNSSDWNVTANWDGYNEDWHNISFGNSFTLEVGETYNYTIRTGSYPQIHHTDNLSTPAGFITCSEFRDVNGRRHGGWIPAIRLGVK